ncbi:MAG: DUF2442 domain-containing protein [Hoeflea sp.]|uniref:DUF2442 domain-containing protein n=1 Tax=Hoeflea sp. TaxID=1940281 RepID=UPI001DFCA851|nr:DUF2442 domain-containing protein [Hoeflea sp.]MBU4531319.1 DUF2442 domain-containing protein [Alphaproteobacteria bacterium]MBU4544176.1 DUF2442 domain-containing protein [Alphaproteobacteria bacterium]MBU4550587.1 DUF2442 domain-containing protein [Alphaproteobacteria bacterium]MBV1724595.1 DUF2442 domain-containing protein [Hoeflea sp.]MBV1760615.1 DUF2442 domain-containing protein [Hoeflea sp.]
MKITRAASTPLAKGGENREGFEPVAARCDGDGLHVTLANGMTVSTPLWWYPRLLKASPEARAKSELSPSGVHWPDLDEDLEIEAMLQGIKSPDAVPPAEAAE